MEHNRHAKHSRHKMWRTLKKYLKTEFSTANQKLQELNENNKSMINGIPRRTCDICKAELREQIFAEVIWKMAEIDMSERAWSKELRKDEEGEECEE